MEIWEIILELATSIENYMNICDIFEPLGLGQYMAIIKRRIFLPLNDADKMVLIQNHTPGQYGGPIYNNCFGVMGRRVQYLGLYEQIKSYITCEDSIFFRGELVFRICGDEFAMAGWMPDFTGCS